MLRELHIENVAVIERADLELGPGLNILTGETGAGKSILVDAMHAILGARVSRELVRTGAEKAIVCATFDPDPCQAWCEENEIECDDELIIRRQITSEGKTSCRVCGVPVTTAQHAGCAAARYPRPERRPAPARRAGAPAQSGPVRPAGTGACALSRAVPCLSGAVQGA